MTLDDLIAIDPGHCGGRPRISGRRIRVQDIAVWHDQLDRSADEIAAEHDLSLAQVHAALAYYFSHQKAIDRAIRTDATLVAELKAKTPSRLREKLDEAD